MSRDSPEDADRLLNGAEIRVFGGLLVGIGISPLVLAILTFPLGSVFDPEVIVLFRYGLSVLLAVFGLTMLHAVGLFYSGDWQSLWVVLTARNSKPRKPSTRSRSLRRLNWTRARLALSVRQDHTRDRMAMHSPADGHEPPQPTALSAGDRSVARMARGTRSLATPPPSEQALTSCSKIGDFWHDERALLSRTTSFASSRRPRTAISSGPPNGGHAR